MIDLLQSCPPCESQPDAKCPVSPTSAGEQLEVVEGVNAPALQKIVADHIPDGMLDTEEETAEAEEGEEEEG